MDERLDEATVEPGFYHFRDLVRQVLSPGALGTLEQLTPRILEIYGLAELLDRQLPEDQREEHAEILITRSPRRSAAAC